MSLNLNSKISLPSLNLPSFEPDLLQKDEKLWIFDSLRKKYLVLTPEEWVRQHWINFLILEHGYPKGLFSLEKGLVYNQLKKRTDLVVFDRQRSPYLIVECKAPSVKLNQTTLEQIVAYNSRLNCPNLILSNGIQHFFLGYSEQEKKIIQQSFVPKSPN